MKNFILLLCLSLTSLVSAELNWSKDNLDKTIKSISSKKQKAVMAYFWQEGCNACEYMSDRVFANDDVSAYINENFIPYKTDTLDIEYPVFAFPAIYFIGADGEELADPVMGARNLDEFLFILEDMKELSLK